MIPPLFYGVELGKQHPLGQQDDANHKVTQELLLWVFVLLLQL